MELFLIRHGQSLNNFQPQEQRVEDPPLTDLGRRQAELLAEWIESAGLTRLICSPFRRAANECSTHSPHSTGPTIGGPSAWSWHETATRCGGAGK